MKTKLLIILLSAAGVVVAQNDNCDGQRKPPTAAEFIQRLDKDGDGKVSKDEFDGPAEHFTASDKNNDGYISKDEVRAGPPPRDLRKPPAAAEFIQRLDKDGDGQVSKAEFDGPAEHFGGIDKNNDGDISKDEAPAGPPPRDRK